MFIKQDLRCLGEMRVGGMDFTNSISRHLLDSLLELKGLEDMERSQRDLVRDWRSKFQEETTAQKKAKEAESKAFMEWEEMKKTLEKAETSLKHKENLVNQAIERNNELKNTLQEARNNLKFVEIQHKKELDELRKQVEAELQQQVEATKTEAVEAYKSSQAFLDAVIEVAMSGCDVGMRFYQAALLKCHLDLDLTALDEQFQQALPVEEPVALKPFSPAVKVVASPELPIKDLTEQVAEQPAIEDLPPPSPPKVNQAESAQVENLEPEKASSPRPAT